MSQRVRIYVGDGLGVKKRPNVSFDLLRGTTLPDALREIANSIDRRKAAPDAPVERFDDGTRDGATK